MTRHHLVNPSSLSEPQGFSHGLIAGEGRTLSIAGQVGIGETERGLVDQFEHACRAVLTVIEASGGGPGDLTSMTIYTTDISTYKSSLSDIGRAYRSVFGGHFPPMALIGVSELFDPGAVVELVCTAVLPPV